jgi:superfamily II DNA or RNA helicase
MEIDQIVKLKRSLTVKPAGHRDFPDPPSFPVFEEGQNWIRIPKVYGLDTFGPPRVDALKSVPISRDRLTFHGTLRDSQLEPLNKTLNHLKTNSSGLLSCATGSGKTVIALSLVSQLGEKTCIVVHKTQLLQQWVEEIKRFLPKIKVSIIQQSKRTFSDGSDVHIVMIQTLLGLTEPPITFGLTICDEVHHIGSETFSKVLFKVNARFLLGLTATLNRKDGLTKVIHWHVGELIFEQKPDRSNQKLTIVNVHRFEHQSTSNVNPKKYAEMITELTTNQHRNEFIFQILRDLLDSDVQHKRRILVLSDRKQHVVAVHDAISNLRPTGMMLGSMKQTIIAEQMKKDVIVSTYGLMSEGISIAGLNTICFASPKRDVIQSMGRIFRAIHDINPMIIDISDTALLGQERSRLRIYKSELNDNVQINFH